MAQTTEPQKGPTQHVPTASVRTPSAAAKVSAPLPNRQAIKIRVVSWNLGDSVPKGDLSSLLGEVPPYHPPDHLVTSLPIFDETDGDGHPYHLIVVAAQECPSASGVPRGLAAGVTKGVIGGLKEKEKLKERGKAKEAKEVEKAEKAWIAQLERIHGTGTEDNSVAATPTQETSPTSYTFPPKPPANDGQKNPTRGDSTDTTAAASIVSSVSVDPSAETNHSKPEMSISMPSAASRDTPIEVSAFTEPQATPVATPLNGTLRTPHHGHHTGHVTTGAKGWSDLLEGKIGILPHRESILMRVTLMFRLPMPRRQARSESPEPTYRKHFFPTRQYIRIPSVNTTTRPSTEPFRQGRTELLTLNC